MATPFPPYVPLQPGQDPAKFQPREVIGTTGLKHHSGIIDEVRNSRLGDLNE